MPSLSVTAWLALPLLACYQVRYSEVVLVERDRFGEVGEQHRGVPQGRHAHGLLPSGLSTLEGFFSGLFQQATNAGGLRIDVMRDSHWWFEGGKRALRKRP